MESQSFAAFSKRATFSAPQLAGTDKGVIAYSCSDCVLQQFMQAHKDPETRFKKWADMVQWRNSYKPHKIQLSEVLSQLNTKKIVLHGVDRQNNPCIYMLQRFHKAKGDNALTVRAIIYLLELALKRTTTQQITIISDRTETGMDNYGTDVFALVKELLQVLQNNYPQRMKYCLVLYPNMLYKFIFKVIRPFMSEHTASKFIQIEEDKQLLNFIDQRDIPRNYGGTSSMQFPSNQSSGEQADPEKIRNLMQKQV